MDLEPRRERLEHGLGKRGMKFKRYLIAGFSNRVETTPIGGLGLKRE
jgi:hypothetical protein